MKQNPLSSPVALSYYAVSGIVGWCFGSFILGDNPFRHIPRDIRIEEGYVRPSEAEIRLEDFDLNGKNETILRVDGIDYLFKYDENKNPFLVKYDIEPMKKIPPKIVLKE
ncbi:hypothetical protein J4477_04035 [Candidatus Pacearchaeota archaeon]|nr:hypothetical protein [Candidatus Pacearchaeota archaeon]